MTNCLELKSDTESQIDCEKPASNTPPFFIPHKSLLPTISFFSDGGFTFKTLFLVLPEQDDQ